MTREERAKGILRILNRLYPHPQVPLSYSTSFSLLVAVLLSAQCTDKRVNSVMPNLLAVADSAAKMAIVPPKIIEEIIRPCGLSKRKAKAISELSKILVKQHRGEVPRSFEDLEALPGIGHKTASVIMLHAFNVPAFPVDTHIHRLANRWMLSNGRNVKQTEKDLKTTFPEKKWGKLHLQMIYYGREYCPARGHRLEHCPICLRFGRCK